MSAVSLKFVVLCIILNMYGTGTEEETMSRILNIFGKALLNKCDINKFSLNKHTE